MTIMISSHLIKNSLYEFLIFGLKQAQSCVFAGSFFVLLFLSHKIMIPGLPRYDFLFLGAVLIQIILVFTKIETIDEVKTIALFHVIGLLLELFKTHPAIGSWSYPEFGYLKIGTVPLYSGFMYAAVGSYIAQAWRRFDVHLVHPHRYFLSGILCVAIYLNFFTHHFWYDIRWLLMGITIILFSKTSVEFTPLREIRKMPVVVSFVLIAFFIWIAENISTFFGAWKYPDQLVTWTTVSIHKIGSWSLLVIISFILIAQLKHLKGLKTT
ncbi:MAG: DUF817 domain-containing protein [Candidatus Magasanikbacteria bacterium]|nr:DUF817 domain-containing protein [Candidatus Magasanikbacteria bacterium]NCS72382.1 DUF817 domain-containing protein [Candidatus Magasanikbacteria bacterium]